MKSKPVKIDDLRSAYFVLLQESLGGSALFAKVAAAIDLPCGTVGTNSVALGDRLGKDAIKKFEAYPNGTFSVTYLDRKENDSFTQKPSAKMTRTFKLTKEWKLIEIDPPFNA